MESISIALPESMRRFVEDRLSVGGYESVGDYVRDLILSDQRREAEERIASLLIEGLDSGEPIPVGPDYWDEKKRKLIDRIGRDVGEQS